MRADSASGILDDYAKWWREQFDVRQAGNGVEILTPMLNRHNDNMSVYLGNDPENGSCLVLSDLGQTLDDLDFDGCDVLGSAKRTSFLDSTLRGFGLSRDGREIFARTSRSELFNSLNFMMQGMSSVDDLFYTSRKNVENFFTEDIAAWLDDHEIRYSQNIRIKGRSGFEAQFDFLIPKTGNKAPERLLKAVSHPTKSSVENALFGCNDIREERPNSAIYLLLNANDARDGKIQQSIIDACTNWDVKPAVWNHGADDVLEALAA